MIDMEKQLEEIRARNAERVEEAKKRLGNRYLCHPDNFVTREKFRKIQRTLLVPNK